MKLNLRLACLGGLLSGGLLLAVAPRASAQDIGPALDMNLMTGWTAGAAVQYDLDRRAAEAKRAGVPDRSPKAGSAPAASQVSFAYSPTPALKQQTVQGYVDRLRPKNPAASQAVAANLGPGKHDYGQIYRTIIQGHGLRDNDAADALAAFMLVGYLIVNNVQDDKTITPAVAQGLRAQVVSHLSTNAKLRAPGVPARLGEEMKLHVVVVQGGWQAAIKEHTLPAYQQGIAALFKNQYAMDMSQFALSNQGFVKK